MGSKKVRDNHARLAELYQRADPDLFIVCSHDRPSTSEPAHMRSGRPSYGTPMLNGAQALIRTLADAGVTTCFTNPGTSEMHFVSALDTVPQMRAVLTLFEGVATRRGRD